MPYAILALAAFFTSALTLFSGFGLGTLLMPVFAIFVPVDLAIAMTAVVHLLNNLFKFALLGRHANKDVVLRFGIPAILAALAGAALLVWLSDLPALTSYSLGSRVYKVELFKLIIAALMIFFAVVEMLPAVKNLEFDRKYLPLGGIVSGLFGGLSGHQGAFRSAFLIRAGLGKEAFIASNVVIACLVDVSRIPIYVTHFSLTGVQENLGLIAIATLAAFAGAFLGSRFLHKFTYRAIQSLVALLLFGIAVALGAGWI